MPKQEKHDPKVIVVLGDSVANGYYDGAGLGWIARLSQKLNDATPYSVYFNNFAVSGDRIFDVHHRLASQVTIRDSDVLFIAVGVNDTYRYGHRDAMPSTSMELRRSCWKDTLELAKANVPNIYVFGLLPVDEARIPARQDDYGTNMFYRNDDIRDYNTHLEQWCKKHGAAFINFYDRFLEAGPAELLEDDVHPNAEGHELLAQWAFETLKGKW